MRRKPAGLATRRRRHLRIMFTDEARFGRMNRIRPCWAPIGTRPEVAAQLIREYIYLYGAVSPKDGTCVYLIMPTSNTACFQAFLHMWRAGLPDKTSCNCSTARQSSLQNLAVPNNITLLLSSAYSRNSIRETSGMNSREKIFKNYTPQIHGRSARQAQAGHPLYRAQSQARPLHHLLPLYRQLTLM